jgi:hypothetical protein
MADPREMKMSPGVGYDDKSRDPIEKMLEQAEKGKLGGTLSGSRPEGTVIRRPFTAPPRDYSTPPSKAPRGMGTKVEGDLGEYRQMEARKVFPGISGKDTSNPLRYRKPATAIDPKFGPGDKVC